MFGTEDREFAVTWRFHRKNRSGEHEFRGPFKGMAGYVDEEYQRKSLDHRGEQLLPLLSDHDCASCSGARLRPDARDVRFAGISLPELCRMSVDDTLVFLKTAHEHLDTDSTRITDSGLHYKRWVTKLSEMDTMPGAYDGSAEYDESEEED